MPDSISVQMLQFTWDNTVKYKIFFSSDRKKKKIMFCCILMLSLWKTQLIIRLHLNSLTEGLEYEFCLASHPFHF